MARRWREEEGEEKRGDRVSDDAHTGMIGERRGLRRNRHRRRGRKAAGGEQKSREGRVKVEKEGDESENARATVVVVVSSEEGSRGRSEIRRDRF